MEPQTPFSLKLEAAKEKKGGDGEGLFALLVRQRVFYRAFFCLPSFGGAYLLWDALLLLRAALPPFVSPTESF